MNKDVYFFLPCLQNVDLLSKKQICLFLFLTIEPNLGISIIMKATSLADLSKNLFAVGVFEPIIGNFSLNSERKYVNLPN